MKNKILQAVDGAVDDLMYYDRKNDDDVPVGSIQDAVDAGIITKQDIIDRFKDQLEAWLGESQ